MNHSRFFSSCTNAGKSCKQWRPESIYFCLLDMGTKESVKSRCAQILVYALKKERDNISAAFHFSVTPTLTPPQPTCGHINIFWPLILMFTFIWLDPRTDIQILTNQPNMGTDQSGRSSAASWYLIDSFIYFLT